MSGNMPESPLRTVLVTNGNLLSLLSLGDFLRKHHDKIAAVVITTRLPSQRSNVGGIFTMWRKSGAAYTRFKLLTNVFLPRRLRRQGLPATVVEFIRHLGSDVPVIKAPDVNAPEIVAQVKSLAPQVLLSFSATTRFSDQLIDTPARLALNAHYALLPGYAGLSPYYWYLHNRERQSGVTLHQIVSRLDAGPIIEQRVFEMKGLHTVMQVLLQQMACVSPLLLRFYDGQTSEANATPQDLSLRSYFRHPTRKQVSEFRANGFRFNAHEDIAALHDRLRTLVT